MSEDLSEESVHTLEEFGFCDDCGREEHVAILFSGRYCYRHIPSDELSRLLGDLN